MLVIVWEVHLYGKITSVGYCMGFASVQKGNQCQLLYGLCICTGR